MKFARLAYMATAIRGASKNGERAKLEEIELWVHLAEPLSALIGIPWPRRESFLMCWGRMPGLEGGRSMAINSLSIRAATLINAFALPGADASAPSTHWRFRGATTNALRIVPENPSGGRF